MPRRSPRRAPRGRRSDLGRGRSRAHATPAPGAVQRPRVFTHSSRGPRLPSRRAHAWTPTLIPGKRVSRTPTPDRHPRRRSKRDGAPTTTFLRARLRGRQLPPAVGPQAYLGSVRRCHAEGGRVRFPPMRVLIMGCGRVGSELSHALGDAGHEVTVIDKRADAFDRYPPGEHARQIVGLGFDRDVLEEAGIREADAFIAVSNGDNSNIVSARVALEHYHVPNVIARIYDPQRAEIYQRLNIPTVATTTWGVKQIMMMLTHPREEIKESLVGGDLFRMRVPVPDHLIGKSVSRLNEEGKVLVAGVDSMGSGFIPVPSSTFQQGDIVQLILQKDGLDILDEM